MTGTFINVAAILIGGSLGLLFGGRLPERLKSTVIAGMGLFTAVTGIKMFMETQNSLIVLGSLVIGALLGEWWKIEDGLQRLGEILEKRFSRSDSESGRFVTRLHDRLAAILHRPDRHPRLDPGRPERRYQPAGNQIRAGRVRCDGICIHTGGGSAIFSRHDPDLPGSHHFAGGPIECDCQQTDDGRTDRHRRCAAARDCHQQPAGNQENPGGKFPAGPGACPADRVDCQPVLTDRDNKNRRCAKSATACFV